METTKGAWDLSAGIAHNTLLDRELRRARTRLSPEALRDEQRRWAQMKTLMPSVLEFLYLKEASEPPVSLRDRLNRLCGHQSIALGRLDLPKLLPGSRALSKISIHQEFLRKAVATLVLRYRDGEDVMDRVWPSGGISIPMKIAYRRRRGLIVPIIGSGARDGLWSPALVDVLSESFRWLRFCPLCGRLFFKIKRQSHCSRMCYGRSTVRRRERKGNDARGRPRVAFESQLEAMHNAWIHLDSRP